MQAGRLRHRITIQLPTEVKDTQRGFTDGTPSVIAARIPAAVVPLSGRELERAQQIDPRISHRVEIRYRADVLFSRTQRPEVVYHAVTGDRTLEVVAPPINLEERNRELHLLCAEAA